MLNNMGVTQQGQAVRPEPKAEDKTEFPALVLGEKHISKLGFKELPAVGTPLAMHGRVQVTGSMMHDGANGKERILHLQITHMQLRNGSEGEHAETDPAVKGERLYGESKEK
jgi:hypothetical protein